MRDTSAGRVRAVVACATATRRRGARPAVHQPFAVTGQVTQLADHHRRHETAPQQAVLQQHGQPLGIQHVALATRQELVVASVDQLQLEARGPRARTTRLPERPRRLHHHRRVTPTAANQSAIASKSAVNVENVRVCLTRSPPSAEVRTHAVTSDCRHPRRAPLHHDVHHHSFHVAVSCSRVRRGQPINDAVRRDRWRAAGGGRGAEGNRTPGARQCDCSRSTN